MNSMMNDQVLQCQGRHHVDRLIVIPIPSRIIICFLDMNMIFYILAPSAHQTLNLEFTRGGECHERRDYEFY